MHLKPSGGIWDSQRGLYTNAIQRELEQLQKKTADRDDYVKSARRIFGWLSPQINFKFSLFRYWEATDPLMDWRKKEDAHEGVAGHLLGTLAQLYGRGFPPGLDEPDFYDGLLAQAIHVAQTSSSEEYRQRAEDRFIATERLIFEYVAWKNAVQDVGHVPDTTSWGHPDEIAEMAATLAPMIAEHQTYGVKSCFVQDGILHSRHNAWVYLDGNDELSKLPRGFLMGMTPPLAIVHLTQRDQLHDLQLKFNPTGAYGNQLSLSSPYVRMMNLAIQPDGTLTADLLYATWPLEKVFKAAGRSESYPVFWLSHLLRVSDLVVPEIVRRKHGAPKWPILPSDQKGLRKYLHELPGYFGTLYLPRRRILESPGEVRRAQEQETHEDKAYTKRSRRSPEHVTWFWRRLPEGYRASPQMRARALAERGKEPPAGYTYVPARGETPGYEAKRHQPNTE